jgi:hypothetical protein
VVAVKSSWIVEDGFARPLGTPKQTRRKRGPKPEAPGLREFKRMMRSR